MKRNVGDVACFIQMYILTHIEISSHHCIFVYIMLQFIIYSLSLDQSMHSGYRSTDNEDSEAHVSCSCVVEFLHVNSHGVVGY